MMTQIAMTDEQKAEARKLLEAWGKAGTWQGNDEDEHRIGSEMKFFLAEFPDNEELIDDWEAACEGDSGDAEHDAGAALADAIQEMLGEGDLIDAAYEKYENEEEL